MKGISKSHKSKKTDFYIPKERTLLVPKEEQN